MDPGVNQPIDIRYNLCQTTTHEFGFSKIRPHFSPD